MSIEITNESPIDVDTGKILAVAQHALNQMGVNRLAELSILLVDSDAMAALNTRWMDKRGPTDVLAFPMDALASDAGPHRGTAELPLLLGDIVLCPQVADRQARAAGHLLDDELHLLTVHGVLHLLGYDHADPETERDMFAVQGRLLRSWREATGITRPMRIPQSAADLPEGQQHQVQPGSDDTRSGSDSGE